ncbi:MAG: hypothetical protein FWG90_05040 [Oscillospiraceae bacterium]|nr:hypothetical protein [Oscillospiraceae bacterium]
MSLNLCKLYIFALLLIVLLAGCSKDIVGNSTHISNADSSPDYEKEGEDAGNSDPPKTSTSLAIIESGVSEDCFLAGEPVYVYDNADYPISADEALELVENALEKRRKFNANPTNFAVSGVAEYGGFGYYSIREFVFNEDLIFTIQRYVVDVSTGEIYLDYDPTLHYIQTKERFPEFADCIDSIEEDDGRTRFIRLR